MGRPTSRIRQARKDLDLTLTEAAKRADISLGYLSMVENGYVPAKKVRERVAVAYETTPEALWPEVTA